MNLRSLKSALSLLLALFLGGCGNLNGDRTGNHDIFDLGLVEPVTPAPAILPASIELHSPSWLSGAAMQYRTDYQQPPQRRAFADSRWASPPGELLERTLQRAFAVQKTQTTGFVRGGEKGCRLRIELDEFMQVFDTPQASHAYIAARAELLPARGEFVIARQLLTLNEIAPSADARGGVVAHQRASAQFVRALTAWLNGLETALPRGETLLAACRE